jgi:hypothetical protein
LKGNQEAHVAVFAIDVGTKDLQQCADAAMRLQAEYLWSRGSADDVAFQATSGDPLPFRRWRAGERPVVAGNRLRWTRRGGEDGSRQSFRAYLETVFRYAGTASLSRELPPVEDARAVEPGDVFVQGGFPGHAVIVVDVARPRAGAGPPRFLLAQSYMPAQEIQLLRNPADPEGGPWYDAGALASPGARLVTPEWTFPPGSLRRFRAAPR